MKHGMLSVLVFAFVAHVHAEPADTKPEMQRGCCVLTLPGGKKCVAASEAYCKQKAEETKKPFDFQAGKSCAEVPACPKIEE